MKTDWSRTTSTLVALRRELGQFLEPLLQQVGHRDGVRARLLADVQQHAGRVVVERGAFDLLGRVLDVAQVADGDRAAVAVGHGDALHLRACCRRGPCVRSVYSVPPTFIEPLGICRFCAANGRATSATVSL